MWTLKSQWWIIFKKSNNCNSVHIFLIAFVTVSILSIVPNYSPFRAWNQHLLKRSSNEQLHLMCVFSSSVSRYIGVMDSDRISLQMWTADFTLSFHAVTFLCWYLCFKMRLPHASPIVFCFHAAGKTGLIRASLWSFRPLCLTGSKADSNLLKTHFRRSFFQSNLLLIKWQCWRQGAQAVWVCLVQIIVFWERHTDSFHKYKTVKPPWD